MRETYQTSGVDMFKHGLMVNEMYQRILKKDKELLEHIHFSPEQLDELIAAQYDFVLMRHYHIYHDCGKPYCISEDKKHYPNHAQISAQIHAEHFDCEKANYLISNDMIFHTLKGDNLNLWLSQNRREDIASLYLSAWAEIFANSQMFGGVDSESFKIKKKSLNKAYKKIKPA